MAPSTRPRPTRGRSGAQLAGWLLALAAAAAPAAADTPTHLPAIGVWLDADPAWRIAPAGAGHRITVGGVDVLVHHADFTADRLHAFERCADLATHWQRAQRRPNDPSIGPAPRWATDLGYGPHALAAGGAIRLCVDRSGVALMVELGAAQLDDAGAQRVAAAVARVSPVSPSGQLVFPSLAIEVPAAAWPSTLVSQEQDGLGESVPGPAQPRWDAWAGLVPQQPVRFRTDPRSCSRQLLDDVSRPSRPGAATDAPAPLLDVAGGIAEGYEPYLLDAGVFGSFLCARVATGALLAHVGAVDHSDAQHERLIDGLELVARLVAARATAAVAPAVLPSVMPAGPPPAITPDGPVPARPRWRPRRWWAHPTAQLEVAMFESNIIGRDFAYGLGVGARWERDVKSLRLDLRGELVPLGGPLTWTAEARAGLRLGLPIDVTLSAGFGADAVGTTAEELPAAPYVLISGGLRLAWFRFEYTHVSRVGAADEVDTERRQLYFLRVPAGGRTIEIGGGWIAYRLDEFHHARGIRIAMGVSL